LRRGRGHHGGQRDSDYRCSVFHIDFPSNTGVIYQEALAPVLLIEGEEPKIE
jgi:hypothetical protein